jgi:hypothetical protein
MLKLSELAQLGWEVRQDDWAELIPDEVYERVGREKPDDGEGRY